MNIQKDSVVNFLTPTKLITTSIKPKSKLSQNQALFTHSSHKRQPAVNQQETSKSYNSHFNKLNYQLMKSQQEESQLLKPKEVQIPYSQKNTQPNKYVIQNKSHHLNNQDNSKIYQTQKIQIRDLEQNYLVGMNSQYTKVDNSVPLPFNSFQTERIKQSHKTSRVSQNNALNIYNNNVLLNESKSRQKDMTINRQFTISQNKQRQQEGIYRQLFIKQSNVYQSSGIKQQVIVKENKITPLELTGLLQQLKDIKKIIDISLKDLEKLLNNTSQYLNTIDEQYARIKTSILTFTSDMLDVGYNKYKKNMVKWQKYESVEKKAVVMTKELINYIEEDQIHIEALRKTTNNSKLCTSKQHELKQKIQLFNAFAAELEAEKAQCFNKRPHITKDKLKVFEEALVSMVAF